MKRYEKLALLRKEKGLTQMELAEELDISRQAVSRWETGASMPTTENLVCLSRLYQVSMDYLLNEDAERTERGGSVLMEGGGDRTGPALGGRGRMAAVLMSLTFSMAAYAAGPVERTASVPLRGAEHSRVVLTD